MEDNTNKGRPAQRIFHRDVASALLSSGPRLAMGSLYAFIAVNRMGASISWAGVINAAVFAGFLWNAFFSSMTARISLQRSIVWLMVSSGVSLCIAGFLSTPLAYGIVVILHLFITGLIYVQYDTLLPHLYDYDERPKKLSARWLAISVAAAALAPALGRLGGMESGHWPAFLLAGVMTMAGGLIFSTIRVGRQAHMQPFQWKQMLRTAFADRRFRRMVVILIIYGWFGAGLPTLLVALYHRYGFSEFQVGIVTTATTAGMIFSALTITPRIHFSGGLSNFRACYTSSAAAAALYLITGLWNFGTLSVVSVATANFIFGVGASAFTIAAQISAVNLAEGRDATVYVNAFKFIQGARGIVFPIIVAQVIEALGFVPALEISFVVVALCCVAAWIPVINGSRG